MVPLTLVSTVFQAGSAYGRGREKDGKKKGLKMLRRS
jgi:hypothetical protein